MENAKNITQIIIETINTILQNLFSSIDNNLYEILDDIIFINQDIISDSFFEKILGANSHNGIILICNSLLFGFILLSAINKSSEKPKPSFATFDTKAKVVALISWFSSW